ncbi:MAG: hypothetical protein K0S33_2485 [Bacteroidetes bacterium]|jgi:hypothetical protein|nr:hypothetical protein [Bacteroidota bacterium]
MLLFYEIDYQLSVSKCIETRPVSYSFEEVPIRPDTVFKSRIIK